MKKCSVCGEEKDEGSFNRKISSEERLRSQCKQCQYEYYRLRREKLRNTFEERQKTDSDKKCNSCGVIKPINDYYVEKERVDGRRSICKQCTRNEAVNRYKRGGEDLRQKRREIGRKRRQDNPVKFLLQSAKNRAKAKGLEYSLDEKDFSIPKTCPVLGIPIFVGRRKDGLRDANSPTLDRVDNSKGYTPDNVVVMSWRANEIKRDATLEELKKLVDFLEKRQQDKN